MSGLPTILAVPPTSTVRALHVLVVRILSPPGNAARAIRERYCRQVSGEQRLPGLTSRLSCSGY